MHLNIQRPDSKQYHRYETTTESYLLSSQALGIGRVLLLQW